MKLDTRKGLAVLAAALMAGCASYYKVTDPASGKIFYTEDVKRRNGTITFKDAKTGADVTLTSSMVLEVSSEEFRKGTAK